MAALPFALAGFVELLGSGEPPGWPGVGKIPRTGERLLNARRCAPSPAQQHPSIPPTGPCFPRAASTSLTFSGVESAAHFLTVFYPIKRAPLWAGGRTLAR